MSKGKIIEYYSFELVLKELEIEEDELKRLVSEGEIRAFRDDDKMKFKKSDIDGLKKGRIPEPSFILPSGEAGDGSEDQEALLIEEDTSETLLDIEDLEPAAGPVPVEVPFEQKEVTSILNELTFEESPGSYDEAFALQSQAKRAAAEEPIVTRLLIPIPFIRPTFILATSPNSAILQFTCNVLFLRLKWEARI